MEGWRGMNGRRASGLGACARVSLAGTLLLLAVFSNDSFALVNHPVSVVALQGQAAPVPGGATFTAFDEPMVNAAGDNAFHACYTTPMGDRCGTFLRRGGTLSAILLSGQPVSGIGTVTWEQLQNVDGPALNNAATIAVAVRSSMMPSNTPAVLQKTLTGMLTVLVKESDIVPRTNGMGKFTSFDDLAQNNNGDVAFIATYKEGTTFKTGIFKLPSGGTLEAIVLPGDDLPNESSSTGCGKFDPTLHPENEDGDIETENSPEGPWMNDGNVVAFQIGADCGFGPKKGFVFAKRPGQPIEPFVIGDGDEALIVKIARPGLNNSNALGYSDGKNVFTQVLGQEAVACVATGDAPSDAHGELNGFGAPAINQSGALCFQGELEPTVGVDIQGMFRCKGGVTQIIALRGWPRPPSGTFCGEVEECSIGDNGLVTFLHEAPNTTGEDTDDDPGCSDPVLGVFVGNGPESLAPAVSQRMMILMAAILACAGFLVLRRRDAKRQTPSR